MHAETVNYNPVPSSNVLYDTPCSLKSSQFASIGRTPLTSFVNYEIKLFFTTLISHI